MRRRRAALVVLMIALLSLLVAGPARAGGPTSVLLVVPEAGQTASLYGSDTDYDLLAGMVGAFASTGTAGKVDESGTTHEFGPGVTVTWLIHDVQVWRVDRIYVGGEGGPWISTQTTFDGSGSLFEAPVVWHTPQDAKVLVSLLDRLGVSPGAGGTGSGAVDGTDGAGDVTTSTAPSPAASAPAAAKQRDAEPDSAGWLSSTGLVWGLGGIVLGAVIVLAGLRLSSGHRPVTGSPASAGPLEGGSAAVRDDHDVPDNDGAWPPTDELSWPAQRR